MNKIRIASLRNNPNTNATDLKVMDHIVTINGKTIADFEDGIVLQAYEKKLLEEGKEMIIQRADGKVFTLKPADDIYQ